MAPVTEFYAQDNTAYGAKYTVEHSALFSIHQTET